MQDKRLLYHYAPVHTSSFVFFSPRFVFSPFTGPGVRLDAAPTGKYPGHQEATEHLYQRRGQRPTIIRTGPTRLSTKRRPREFRLEGRKRRRWRGRGRRGTRLFLGDQSGDSSLSRPGQSYPVSQPGDQLCQGEKTEFFSPVSVRVVWSAHSRLLPLYNTRINRLIVGFCRGSAPALLLRGGARPPVETWGNTHKGIHIMLGVFRVASALRSAHSSLVQPSPARSIAAQSGSARPSPGWKNSGLHRTISLLTGPGPG